MSNQNGIDNTDANNSETEANNGEKSSTQNQPQNSESNQSNRQDNVDVEGGIGFSLSPHETSSLEIQELTNDESSQRNNSDDDGSESIIYEFPSDSEEIQKSEPMRQNQKRQRDENNVHFRKKSKKGKLNATDNETKEKEKSKLKGPSMSGRYKNDSVKQDCKDSEVNRANNKEPRNSSESVDNHRHIVKAAHRLFKGKDNKKPTRIETHDKTNAFKRVVTVSSTSSGALADVEDNADNQSNEDTSDDSKKTRQYPISNNTNAISTEGALADIEDNADSQSNDDISDDHEKRCQDSISNTNSTEQDKDWESTPVDMDKDSAVKKQTKTNTSSTSQRVVSGATTSTNQSKIKSDVGGLKKRRCFVCNKKVGLTAFTCRCGGLYCSQHRYDKEHDCDFDYKSMGAEEIRKNNPVIVAEKISKL